MTGGPSGPQDSVLPAPLSFAPPSDAPSLPASGPPFQSQSGEPPHPWRAVTRVLRGCSGGLKIAAADLLHAALPSDCRICGSPMLGLTPVRVCKDCIARVRAQAETPDTFCTRCGDALGMESARFAASMGIGECTACRVNPPAFARAVAFGRYDNEMREMLQALKFQGMRRVADHVLGRWIAEAILQLEGHAARELIVVPVPLFHLRERQRGFNQASLLALAGLKQLKRLRPEWTFVLRPEALLRVRDTRALYELRPDQRRRSLQGAFRVGDAWLVRGREVVLVDDIYTTGATANACARVLLRAGAARVWVATVARAQPESVQAVATSVARSNVAHWDVVGTQPPAG